MRSESFDWWMRLPSTRAGQPRRRSTASLRHFAAGKSRRTARRRVTKGFHSQARHLPERDSRSAPVVAPDPPRSPCSRPPKVEPLLTETESLIKIFSPASAPPKRTADDRPVLFQLDVERWTLSVGRFSFPPRSAATLTLAQDLPPTSVSPDIPSPVPRTPPKRNWIDQTQAQADAKSVGCNRVPRRHRADAFFSARRARLHRLPRRKSRARPDQGSRRTFCRGTANSGRPPPIRRTPTPG